MFCAESSNFGLHICKNTSLYCFMIL